MTDSVTTLRTVSSSSKKTYKVKSISYLELTDSERETTEETSVEALLLGTAGSELL